LPRFACWLAAPTEPPRAARSEANDIRSTITVDAGAQNLDRPEASPIVAAVKKLTAKE
jgi:hypothetical protein